MRSRIQKNYNTFVKRSCRRDPSLEKAFDSFNKLYFQDSLPNYRVLVCSKTMSYAPDSAGFCSPEERRIYLRAGTSANVELQTLMHEMTHAKLSWIEKEDHGTPFINELKRVRKLGAPLSLSELDLKEGREIPRINRKHVRNYVREGLVVEGLPKELIPRYLEREFEVPFSEIRKAVDLKKIIREISSELKTHIESDK